MHIKKFAALFAGILGLGLLILSFKDFIFMAQSESQVAQVSYHVPAGSAKFYKIKGGEYEERALKPAIVYEVEGTKITYLPEYSCTDGCQKVGSEVTVFYQKDRPRNALILSFGGFWKYKVYFLIVMGVLLLTALPYVYYTVNRPRGS